MNALERLSGNLSASVSDLPEIRECDLRAKLRDQAAILDQLFRAMGLAAMQTPPGPTQAQMLRIGLRAQSQFAATVRVLDALAPTRDRPQVDVRSMSDAELIGLVYGVSNNNEVCLD